MKKGLLFAALLLTAVVFNASAAGKLRLIELGMKAGYHQPRIGFEKTPGSRTASFEMQPRWGMHAGITARINLPALSLQSELLYSTSRYTFMEAPGNHPAEINGWNVPVMLSLRVWILRLNAGPVFKLSSKARLDGKELLMLNPSVSYTAGAGIDLGKWYFDVRYNGCFKQSEFPYNTDTETTYFKIKPASVAFSAARFF